MTGFELRSCCRPLDDHDTPPGAFTERADAPSRLAFGAAIAPAEAPQPDRATCWHELGHATAIYLAGGRVSEILLTGENPVCRQVPPGLPPGADTVMVQCGPAAQRRAEGFGRPDSDGEVAASWRRVNAPAGGRCDACVAMRHAVMAVGLDREAEAVALYKKTEALAHRIVWHPEVERVIRLATHELMRDGRMDGERFHEIAGEVIASETVAYFRKELHECWQFSNA